MCNRSHLFFLLKSKVAPIFQFYELFQLSLGGGLITPWKSLQMCIFSLIQSLTAFTIVTENTKLTLILTLVGVKRDISIMKGRLKAILAMD